MSFQAALENNTPFSARKLVLPDCDGQENVLVVTAAKFVDTGTGSLQLSEEQPPIRDLDECYGDPSFSSVRYEAELALFKPLVDVIVNGHAYAPGGRRVGSVPIALEVGDIHKRLIVSGDRFWRIGAAGVSPSSPEPFVTLPLVYERAFGGIETMPADPADCAAELRNLVGVGFRGARSRDRSINTEIPNVEYPHSRMNSKSDVCEPASLGVVSRGWQPRLKYAGTYNREWLERRWPLLPIDFDPLFNQCVSRDQQSHTVRGGETVSLSNMTHEGEWRFELPKLEVPMHLIYDDREAESMLRTDTILIEPDSYSVTLFGRAAIIVERNRPLMREIILGHVTRGWLRARLGVKQYISHAHRKTVTADSRGHGVEETR